MYLKSKKTYMSIFHLLKYYYTNPQSNICFSILDQIPIFCLEKKIITRNIEYITFSNSNKWKRSTWMACIIWKKYK